MLINYFVKFQYFPTNFFNLYLNCYIIINNIQKEQLIYHPGKILMLRELSVVKEILSCPLFYLINEKMISKHKMADHAEFCCLNPA